ncbi:MAG: RNA methyltransferase [Rikenellaceae bacterium]|nr:RNA methyltransferase [Rikenellaceae bacterium]
MLTKNKIQYLKSLQERKIRSRDGLFVAEGFKLVSDLIESDMVVREVYALGEYIDKLPFFENIFAVSGKDMERISGFKNPSGVFATIEIPRHEYSINTVAHTLSIALDGVQDPGNLGTIIRTADWFGIDNIFCSENTADCYNPKVVQATMGALSKVSVHYCDLAGLFATCRGCGTPVYGTFLEGQNIYDAELSDNGIIVLGNEGKGISPQIQIAVTDKLFIPPYSQNVFSGSLNVSTAAAVICSEFRRRKF